MMVMKSACKWVKLSGRAIIRAESWIETSKAPTVVTENAVHSHPCQFSESSFMFQALPMNLMLYKLDGTSRLAYCLKLDPASIPLKIVIHG